MKEEKSNPVPRHVAIIMDGNGRWAKMRNAPRLKGHEEGTRSVETIIRACKRFGIQFLTLYAFSTENWLRPPAEISGLMSMLEDFLKSHEEELIVEQIRLRAIGRLGDLPRKTLSELQRVMKVTEKFTRRQLILALSYGSRDEITQGARAAADLVKSGKIKPSDIDERLLESNFFAPDIPHPDLVIRTSGEIRLSNFLLWQAAYAEFYFTNTLWPDFREKDFEEALAAYAQRQRRFGRTD